MGDATINPVGPYDPVSRLPDGGGRGRRDSPDRQPSASRSPSGSAPAAPDAASTETPDPDATRGRHIDDRA